MTLGQISATTPAYAPTFTRPAAEVSPDSVQLSVTRAIDTQGLTLKQLGGARAQRQEMQSLVDALAQMRKIPSQTYLVNGNSGTGKTALVQGLAGDLQGLGIPTLSVTGGELLKGGADAIVGAIQEARQAASNNQHHTAVLFVDDIESVTRIRSSDSTTTAIHASNLLATFTDQLDKVVEDTQNQVVVIGATSRKDTMDWAATQRFQRTILTEAPADSEERVELLKAVAQRSGQTVDESVLRDLASGTGGKNQRELQHLLRKARQKAGDGPIELRHVRETRLEASFGPAAPVTSPDWMFRLSVSHELGHAVIRHLFDRIAIESQRPDHRPMGIDCLSFVPREGTTASVALKYSGNPAKTLEYYYAEMASNYGGRAAEYLFGDGHISAGPGNDIFHASRLDQEAVQQKGMGKTLGPADPSVLSGEAFADRAQADKQRLIESSNQTAMTVVNFYGDFIKETAENFLAHKSNPDALVWSGEEFTQALLTWEKATPERAVYLEALKEHLKAEMQDLQPEMPMIWDPIAKTKIPAKQAAARLSYKF